jgi:hypothetical protein
MCLFLSQISSGRQALTLVRFYDDFWRSCLKLYVVFSGDAQVSEGFALVDYLACVLIVNIFKEFEVLLFGAFQDEGDVEVGLGTGGFFLVHAGVPSIVSLSFHSAD